jgi:polysaccharide pyruvyl transferase WcaK-like protein
LLKRLLECDLIAAVSGGDSFSDIYGLVRLFYVSWPQVLVLLLQKDLVLLPQTLGPFKGGTAKATAKYILSRVKRVFTRDSDGRNKVAASLGAEFASRVQVSYDVGFALEPRPPKNEAAVTELLKFKKSRPLVGVNISGLLYMGGYSRRNMFGLCIDYPSFARCLIKYLVEEKQAAVLLVPHVYGEGTDSESDVIASKKIHDELAQEYGEYLRVLEDRYTEGEVKFVIGKCDFFTGSRMHACIAAVSQCVPSVPVAYSEKFIGVMRTIGTEAYVADARKMPIEEILQMMGKTLDDRVAIRAKLEGSMPQVKQRVLQMFDDIEQR